MCTYWIRTRLVTQDTKTRVKGSFALITHVPFMRHSAMIDLFTWHATATDTNPHYDGIKICGVILRLEVNLILSLAAYLPQSCWLARQNASTWTHPLSLSHPHPQPHPHTLTLSLSLMQIEANILTLTDWHLWTDTPLINASNTHHHGDKYHCSLADLLFDWFGFNQTRR